jgi:hypothetical protein
MGDAGFIGNQLFFNGAFDFSSPQGNFAGTISQISPVPLPPTWPLFASAIVGLGACAWHRRRSLAAK